MHKQQIAWISGAVLLVHGVLLVYFSNTDQLTKEEETIVQVPMTSQKLEISHPKATTPSIQKEMSASRPNSPPVAAVVPNSSSTPTTASLSAPSPMTSSASLNVSASHHSTATTTPSSGAAPQEKPAPIELPTTLADYKNRAQPQYPRISKRLGEQGRVVVQVLIGVDGQAQQAQIAQSSGYDRLDQSALDAVLQWSYVPGQRGGVPEAMWFQIPIQFKMENK
ncbi:MAG: energy transducer TonB [Limnohabitans sp.]|nr:energy transducer TonB [Limnohabitans sp.]